MRKACFGLGFSGLLLVMLSGCFVPSGGNYNQTQQPYVENDNNQQNYNQGYQEGYNQAYQQQAYQQQAYVQCVGVSDEQFYQLKENMKYGMSVDKYTKDIVSVTTGQVSELMYAADFDSKRMDIAAALYPKVCDPENFELVYNAVSSDYKKQELRNRIETLKVSSSVNNNYNNGYGYNNNGYNQPAVLPPPPPMQQCGMMDGDFANLKNSISNASFKDDRLRIIQSAAPYNTFWVSQVVEILNLMSFDDEKIDAAVILYNSVCDVNNWYQVYNAFSFSSSKDTLNQRLGL